MQYPLFCSTICIRYVPYLRLFYLTGTPQHQSYHKVTALVPGWARCGLNAQAVHITYNYVIGFIGIGHLQMVYTSKAYSNCVIHNSGGHLS